MLGLRYKTL